jgi:nitrogen regulatory protein PII
MIRNERLQQVQEALLKARIRGFTVSATLGMGESPATAGPTGRPALVQHLKVEAALPDLWVSQAVEILRQAATTGKPGDGVIFVYDLDRAVKIRSGEEGEEILIPAAR